MPRGDEQRLAVADLGSNSFRLVVFTATDEWWKRTDEIYEAVRIGEGLAAPGGRGQPGVAPPPGGSWGGRAWRARRRRWRSSPTSARPAGFRPRRSKPSPPRRSATP